MSSPILPGTLEQRALVVIGFGLLLPVLLTVAVFPTAMYDTRELIAWGREFPLVTPFHPPMMTWIGGLVDKFFGTSATAMVLTGQILIAVGLFYFNLTLRHITTRDNALFFTFLYGTSIYTVFAPLSFALNADILQLTSWPAILFHFLRAAKTDRIPHWVAFGAWSAVAALTKYNAAVLFIAIAVSILIIPAYRTTLKRPGLYAAVLVGGLLITPHVIAIIRNHAALSYGLNHFDAENSLLKRLKSVVELFNGYAVFFAPGWIVLAVGLWKGLLKIRTPASGVSPEQRFLIFTAIAAHIALGILALLTGLNFISRFTPPYIMLMTLALAPLVNWSADCQRWVDREVIPTIGGVYLAAGIITVLIFTFFVSHSIMQEPTAEGARLILKDWDSAYSCGPAYIVGDRQLAYGVGIEAHRDTMALAYQEVRTAPWFDSKKFRAEGAIVIDYVPGFSNRMASHLSDLIALGPNSPSEEKKVSVPLRRSHTGKEFSYSYRFIAPESCRPSQSSSRN